MFDVVCYLIGLTFLGIAALAPAVPYRDRFAYFGLGAIFLPLLVHAIQTT